MDVHLKIDELKQQGFVNVGSSFLTQSEINELCAIANNIFEAMTAGHPDSIPVQSGVEGVMRVPQHHPRVAELLDHLLSNNTLKSILKALLGPDYKIWQVNLRRSSPGDKGLYLHQDAPGETNLCILLSDNMMGFGATAFLSGSHLVPKRMKDLRVEAPPFLLMLMRYLFAPLTGKAGDVGFFLNRTWHGRLSNRSCDSQDVILVSFFPAGHCLGYKGYGGWSSAFLSAIQGTELCRLIDPTIGTERQCDGRYKILSKENNANSSLPYALAIESYQGNERRFNDIKLNGSIVFLRLIMGVGRPFARLFRKMIGVLRWEK